jgi:hypothetical protein
MLRNCSGAGTTRVSVTPLARPTAVRVPYWAPSQCAPPLSIDPREFLRSAAVADLGSVVADLGSVEVHRRVSMNRSNRPRLPLRLRKDAPSFGVADTTVADGVRSARHPVPRVTPARTGAIGHMGGTIVTSWSCERPSWGHCGKDKWSEPASYGCLLADDGRVGVDSISPRRWVGGTSAIWAGLADGPIVP